MLSKRISKEIKNAPATRKVYEEGLELKKIHGDDNVVDFSLGNPVIEPPDRFNSIVAELVREKKGLHRYMPNAGYLKTRDAVASYINSKGYLEGVTAEHVVMCVGAAGALNVVLKTILNVGEEVSTISPYFQEYRFHIKNHQGKQVLVQASEDGTLDLNAIEKSVTKKTKALILNTPNNPTGVIYSKKSLEDLASMLSDKEKSLKRDIYIISDEPYREMVYEGSFASPATFHRNSFIVYSWSKSLSLPGERIGYTAVNPNMKHKDDITKGLAFCNRALGFVNAPAMMQNMLMQLINSGHDTSYYEYMRNYYKSLYEPLLECLDENGYDFVRPQGAFFFWVRCPSQGKSPLEDEKLFVEDMKKNFLLLTVPGSAFGRPGWFRIAYAVTPEIISKGCEKLSEVAKKYSLKKD